MKPQQRKYPWLAASLSLLLPGLGQIYAGEIIPGIAFMAATVTLTSRAVRYMSEPGIELWLPALFALLAFAVYIFGLVHAYRAAASANWSRGLAPPGGKDPWLASFLSIIIPGLGHIYAGRILTAIGAFILWCVLNGVVSLVFWLFPVLPALTTLIAVHAHSSVPDSRARRKGMMMFVIVALAMMTLVSAIALFAAEGIAETLGEKLQ